MGRSIRPKEAGRGGNGIFLFKERFEFLIAISIAPRIASEKEYVKAEKVHHVRRKGLPAIFDLRIV